MAKFSGRPAAKPKPENTADYQLIPEADTDVLEIARYTIKTWGEQQAERYEGKLRRCFEAIASGRAKARELLNTRSDLLVVRCENHFYPPPK